MVLVERVPTYEYECRQCPRVFEVWQRISEPPLATCDRCGAPVRRLLAAAPFILKGAGWHATDYPSESRKKAMTAESTATSGSSGEPKSSTGSAGESQGSGQSGSPAGEAKAKQAPAKETSKPADRS
jgi:putative FmdB family regulatory protein